jgi:tetratricopeptide (TPR) repeat protein
MANLTPSTLSASTLEAFLDQTEEALEQQIQTELASPLVQGNLRAVMQRYQYCADTIESVRRLARLWSRAGEPDAALRVLDQDGRAVLAAVPGDEYDDTHLMLALTRVEVLSDSPTRALPDAEAAYTLLSSLAHGAQSQEAWSYLCSLTVRMGLFELERRCVDGHHAYQCAQAARLPFRAYDKGRAALGRARSYACEGASVSALAAAVEAVQAFQEAGPEQDLDVEDWLYLGDSLVTLMPQGVAAIVERVHELTSATTLSLPRRRDIAVRAARVQARALYQQGALAEALDAARVGRYALSSDDDDAFSALMLDWLLEAGQHSEAAELAFESAFNERVVSLDHACRIALAQLANSGANSGSSSYWPLVLAWASTVDSTRWVVGQDDPTEFFEAHLRLARQGNVALPAIDAVQGLYLTDIAHDYAAALPLLESAARDPGLASSYVVPKIWECRMRLHGVERALQMPFVEVACAGWCYHIGVVLQDNTHEEPGPSNAWPKQAVDALAARYYERGAALFERFFATGQGMYRDADVHVYSMLCNNLAIHYRINAPDYHAAITLHRKGIAASAFAEHHEGVMYCLFLLEDEPGYIEAADQLWQFATACGYSRHSPARYILDLVQCLHRQERGAEITVWLQRLEQWWNLLDEDERSEHAGDYWDAMSVALYFMGYSQEADALACLDTVLPELCDADRPMATRMAANSLSRAGQHERALVLYRQAVTQTFPPDEWGSAQRAYALRDLAECERQIRVSRPWWRIWK